MDYINLIIKHLGTIPNENDLEIAIMVAHSMVEAETGKFYNLSMGDIEHIKDRVIH